MYLLFRRRQEEGNKKYWIHLHLNKSGDFECSVCSQGTRQEQGHAYHTGRHRKSLKFCPLCSSTSTTDFIFSSPFTKTSKAFQDPVRFPSYVAISLLLSDRLHGIPSRYRIVSACRVHIVIVSSSVSVLPPSDHHCSRSSWGHSIGDRTGSFVSSVFVFIK
jgi:hypothetical protein